MNPEPSIKNILIQFLSGTPNMICPPIELNIINLNPVQATDSYLDYVDLSNLQEAILSRVGSKFHRNFKITLYKWKFTFNRVPNSNEFYFDIDSSKFLVNESFDEHDGMPSRLAEDDDVLYAFEKKRRQEIRASMKMNGQYPNPQRGGNPPRVRRKQIRRKRNSKLRPIKGVLKNNSKNKKRSSKSYSRSRGRSSSKDDRSFSRGRSTSRGRELIDMEDALSIADLSNMGDAQPASYISDRMNFNNQIISNKNYKNDIDIDFDDAVSITSNTNTLELNQLISIKESSIKKQKKKRNIFNSAKVQRTRSRSRSKDLKPDSVLRKQGALVPVNLFRDKSNEIVKRNKKIDAKKNFNFLEKIDLNEIKGKIGTQGKFRELSKQRKAMRQKKFNSGKM